MVEDHRESEDHRVAEGHQVAEDHPVVVEAKEAGEVEVVHHHLVHPVAVHLAVAVVEAPVAEAVVDVKMNYVVK